MGRPSSDFFRSYLVHRPICLSVSPSLNAASPPSTKACRLLLTLSLKLLLPSLQPRTVMVQRSACPATENRDGPKKRVMMAQLLERNGKISRMKTVSGSLASRRMCHVECRNGPPAACPISFVVPPSRSLACGCICLS